MHGISLKDINGHKGLLNVGAVPEGYDAFLVAQFLQDNPDQDIVFIARDDVRLQVFAEMMGFFAPKVDVLPFLPWDCLPYDRVSPSKYVTASRLQTLSRLVAHSKTSRCIVTTSTAWGQYIVPPEFIQNSTLALRVWDDKPLEQIVTYCAQNGYQRVETVRDVGEYAVRGGIIDLFPAGQSHPLRLDFFGDTLEHIRTFDPLSQLTEGICQHIDLFPVSEIFLTEETIQHFRNHFRSQFGADALKSPLYENITQGKVVAGQEHWLSLFYGEQATLENYVPNALLFFDHQSLEAYGAHQGNIKDYYKTRHLQNPPYYPVAPESMYKTQLAFRKWVQFSPFVDDGGLDMQGKAWKIAKDDPLDNLAKTPPHIIALHSEGSRDRAQKFLEARGMDNFENIATFAKRKNKIGLAILPLSRGFTCPDLMLATEEDLFGERLNRRRQKKANKALALELNNFQIGDLLVHEEHGVGKFMGLENLQIADASHDCLQLMYAKGDKLFIPVENIDVLSLYGTDQEGISLDNLGSASWQNRKARVKERITAMADHLIQVAALRKAQAGVDVPLDHKAYDAFCDKFPYAETDDQLNVMEDILNDFTKGVPADRLICGDVGFGKTEVAIRAAFLAAAAGYQVAVLAPTTILSRQHYASFQERFEGFPMRISHLSRLLSVKEQNAVHQGLTDGSIDIVVATHTIFSKKTAFKNLGLVIIDEEQHFGVEQKEFLKHKYPHIHMLSLSATPIPRTLQMSMAGIRDISLITTPPVDRLASHTYILPYDKLVIREAILREHYRGGKIFYVCPRITDIHTIFEQLLDLVPEVKVAIAHGKLPPKQLDQIMQQFMGGKYDVLVATSIVESGLDIPTANTLIVHRADMFGLAQLYQLRGRVGRSKVRGYAYFTTTPDKILTPLAQRRLEVMQSLDSLGAGFALASQDMDIRGAGNLVGEEQSGQIKEVGVALYQSMLEEAVLNLKDPTTVLKPQDWSPQLNLGLDVFIPDTYVADLNLRLSLYRQVSSLETEKELRGFAAELVDRFGKLPDPVENLLEVIKLKNDCKKLNIHKIDVGPKGVLISFYKDTCPYGDRLIALAQKYFHLIKLRPDQKVVLQIQQAKGLLSGLQEFLGWMS